MGRIAADAQVVHLLADLPGIIFGPLVIGREELHHLVAHFGYRRYRGGQIFAQFSANGKQLQPHWNCLVAGGPQGQGRHRAGCDKRSSSNALYWFHDWRIQYHPMAYRRNAVLPAWRRRLSHVWVTQRWDRPSFSVVCQAPAGPQHLTDDKKRSSVPPVSAPCRSRLLRGPEDAAVLHDLDDLAHIAHVRDRIRAQYHQIRGHSVCNRPPVG